MSYTKLYIHSVWATKLRIPFLNECLRKDLFYHIIRNAQEKSIDIVQIGGWKDHVHVLIKMHSSQNLASLIHTIKGESSFWINNLNTDIKEFAWQDSYYAETIGLKDIKAVREYIRNQEKHHLRYSFSEEKKEMKIKS